MQVLVRVLSVFVLWLMASGPAAAQYVENLFAPLDGFTHFPLLRVDSNLGHGLLLSGRGPSYGSPVIADLDGISANGKEIAVAGSDGRVYAYSSSGELLWSVLTPNSACGSANNRVNSSPAVGDLFGNGVPYVVVTYGGVVQRACDGGVVAFRGSDGAKLWNFSLKSWGKKARFGESFHAVFNSAALKDTDADGKMEIGFGAFDRRVYLLNADGSVRWFYQAADTVWSSPAFYDIDADGRDEMIFATDISANGRIKPPTQNGGLLYALPTASLRGKEIPFRTGAKWMAKLQQTPFSSPAIGELLPSNPGAEIAIFSGYYFSNKKGREVKIFSALSGKLLMSLEASTPSATSVAIGDLNADGINEVVATISGAREYGGSGDGEVRAWTPAKSSSPLWSIVPKERGGDSPFYFSSPLIAGLDSNASQEVLVANGKSVVIIDGPSGAQLTCPSVVCTDQRKSLYTFGSLTNSPAVGDLDGDGRPEVVAVNQAHRGSSKNGALFVWKDFEEINSSPISGAAYPADWPQARANAARSGAKQ